MATGTNIYQDIAARTAGNIYMGIVGPVRTGKSTFIKRFMDLLVLPNVADAYEKERVQDELPQSGSGRTIMTTEPKFIPAEAVSLNLPGNLHLKVRLVDCVGYMVKSAMGHMENGQSRMVHTPWKEEAMPFEEAAEYGTRKVINDHSTVGIVVTTDGSIGDFAREDYLEAEKRVVEELSKQGKPFVVVLNSAVPESPRTAALAAEMEETYGVPVEAVNCAMMNTAQLERILTRVLTQFPAMEIGFCLPGFIEGLPNKHRIKSGILESIRCFCGDFETVRDVENAVSLLADGAVIQSAKIESVDLGRGSVRVVMEPVSGLFYQVIGEIMDCEIQDDSSFFALLKDCAGAKRSYDKLAAALEQVEEEGYGIVQPELTDMVLEEPEIFKQGSKFGVRLRAQAPSLHIIKTSVSTEVAPVVGSERQSEDLIEYLLSEFESDPAKIWDTNIFGKSLQEMVTEQMENKLANVPHHIRSKLRNSLQKISDEGKEYLICVVL